MFVRPVSQRDLSVNPYPDSVYWAVAVGALLGCLFFAAIDFAHLSPTYPGAKVPASAMAAILLFACAQSLERLFAAGRAQARTLSFTPDMHRKLWNATSFMLPLWCMCTLASLILRHVGNDMWRAVGDDLFIYGYGFVIAGICMKDLRGLRASETGTPSQPQTTV